MLRKFIFYYRASRSLAKTGLFCSLSEAFSLSLFCSLSGGSRRAFLALMGAIWCAFGRLFDDFWRVGGGWWDL
jgi:hypothetical protein